MEPKPQNQPREETRFLHELGIEELIETLIEIELVDPKNFLIIKESLTRMGIASLDGKTLFQSCHILTKRKKFYIVHFKELFALDGREVSMSKEDLYRRNHIAKILENWKLLTITKQYPVPVVPRGFITIVSHAAKVNWELKSKYNGFKKKLKEIEIV